MRGKTTVLVAMAFAAVATVARAQTPAAGAQQKTPVQHQPATPVHPAQQLAATESSAPEKLDPAEEAAIRHLLDITDQTKIGDHISAAISMQVRSIMGRSLSEDRLQKFMLDFDLKLHTKVPSTQFVDLSVPIYAQYFSAEDIKGLIRFYESHLGQRVVKTMPQVAQDSQEAGFQIERQAAFETLSEMSDEYPELKPMLSTEPKPSAAPAPNPEPAPNAAPPKN
jgi:hypothetical protein